MDNQTLERAFKLAMDASSLSDCIMRKVGATLVRDDEILATGNNRSLSTMKCCNLFLPTEKDNHKIWSATYEIHAEIDCITNCCISGVATKNTEMVITYSPCTACAQAIIAAGIKKVYVVPETNPEKIINKNMGIFLLLSNNVEVTFLNEDGYISEEHGTLMITIITGIKNILP